MNYNTVFDRVLIYDGSHALHRALSVPNNWEMMTTTGIRTGGVFGTLRTIQKELNTYNYFPIVVFDGSLSKRRLELYPNYKRTLDKQALNESTEPKTEEQLFDELMKREYNTQRNMLETILPAFGIPVIHLQDWEGDDIIYILSKLSKNSIVVSDDKDLLQLIRDDDTGKCRVRRAMRDEFWDINTLKEKNLNIDEYIACKAIVGDGSDNIPSACYQVGEKTAPGLYQLYKESINRAGGFPKTEEELTKICKETNLPKRKAYLNFNESQFLTNVALTDLSLVDKEINENLINNIYQDVINKREGKDKEIISKAFNTLEIKTFDIDTLMNRVASLSNYLFNTPQDVTEINKPKGKLF